MHYIVACSLILSFYKVVRGGMNIIEPYGGHGPSSFNVESYEEKGYLEDGPRKGLDRVSDSDQGNMDTFSSYVATHNCSNLATVKCHQPSSSNLRNSQKTVCNPLFPIILTWKNRL